MLKNHRIRIVANNIPPVFDLWFLTSLCRRRPAWLGREADTFLAETPRGFKAFKRVKIPPPAHNPLAYGAGNPAPLMIKMEKFIVVNGRILDFAKYRDDFSVMQKIIALDIKEYFIKLGFKQSKVAAKKSFRNKLNFYSNELDFEIMVTANKKQKLQFV